MTMGLNSTLFNIVKTILNVTNMGMCLEPIQRRMRQKREYKKETYS